MKKLLILALLGLVSSFSQAATTTVTVPGNTMSNLMFTTTFPIKVTDVIVTASGASGAVTVQLMDVNSFSLSRTNPPYTNTISWATNLVTSWTNYYGVVNTFTNTAIAKATNNLVAQSVRAVLPTITASAAANTSTELNGVSYYFNYGLWATNTSVSNAAVTITYSR